jgi:hypothetical protein
MRQIEIRVATLLLLAASAACAYPLGAATTPSVFSPWVGAVERSGGGVSGYWLEAGTLTGWFVTVDGGLVGRQPLTVRFSTGMSQAFYDLVQANLGGKGGAQPVGAVMRMETNKGPALNGAIIGVDSGHREVNRRDFTNSLITKVVFPACDASSKDQMHVTVQFTPQTTRLTTSNKPGNTVSTSNRSTQMMLPANFRLTIDGLDCTMVSKIEAITVNPGSRPSDLVVTLPKSHAQAFLDWAAGKGEKLRNGKLEYLASNMQQPFFDLNFEGVSITGVSELQTGGSEESAHVRAILPCQALHFQYYPAASK